MNGLCVREARLSPEPMHEDAVASVGTSQVPVHVYQGHLTHQLYFTSEQKKAWFSIPRELKECPSHPASL